MRISIFAIILLLSIAISCNRNNKSVNDIAIGNMQTDTLEIVTLDISYSHYTFNNKESGYHYDLIRDFAETCSLEYRIRYTSSIDSIYYYLDNGICDLAAYNVLPRDGYYACGDTLYSPICIIGRDNIEDIRDLTQNSNLKIYCPSAAEAERTMLYASETGSEIDCIVTDSSTEDLFNALITEKIDYIACYKFTSDILRYEFPETGTSYDISLPYRLSWTTKDKTLADSINSWFGKRKRQKTRTMYNYEFLATSGKRDFRYISRKHNIISNYDSLFKQYVKEIGWDWRLLAALSHTESNFDQEQVSASGAIGLMQMMGITAKAAGIPKENLFFPKDNMETCITYIKALQKSFSNIKDKNEQIKFILGAYNSGLGHIFDAMALARKYDEDEQNWNSVVKYLLLKKEEAYYNDEVCKFGKFNGKQTETLVNTTLKTYNFYLINFK